MHIEYEATFENVDKDAIRAKLKEAGATLVRPEFVQKRVVFNLPKGHEIPGGWLRVRNEGDKVTMSLKVVNGDKIEDQKEICLTVDDVDNAVEFLTAIGAERKAYQETKRELWRLDGTEITIDEWPFLEPFVEVEGPDEATVRAASEKAGFDYATALFCSVDTLYARKYGFEEDVFNNQSSLVVFDMENPFITFQKI